MRRRAGGPAGRRALSGKTIDFEDSAARIEPTGREAQSSEAKIKIRMAGTSERADVEARRLIDRPAVGIEVLRRLSRVRRAAVTGRRTAGPGRLASHRTAASIACSSYFYLFEERPRFFSAAPIGNTLAAKKRYGQGVS